MSKINRKKCFPERKFLKASGSLVVTGMELENGHETSREVVEHPAVCASPP